MGIVIEFVPDLCLRLFGTDDRDSKECLPEDLIVGEVHNFLKEGQRNFWMLGEFPLRETKGNGVLSRPLASVVLLDAAHFVKDGEVWTCGRYEIKEVYDPSDDKVHFDGLEKINKTEDVDGKLKVTICGSIAFYDEMVAVKYKLEAMGHKVDLPPRDLKDEKGDVISVKDYYKIRQNADDDEAWVWERKGEAINWHNKKIDWADVILVLNYEKKGINSYVGSNTLMEMGIAFYLGKRIYLLNGVPDISAKEEILGMKPIVINGKLEMIK